MQVHYVRPGLVWLNLNHLWYLVAARNGVVYDRHLVTAIYLIDRCEIYGPLLLDEMRRDDEKEGEWDWSFHLRMVEFTGEEAPSRITEHTEDAVTYPVVHLHCDLFIHDDEPPQADAAVERGIRLHLDGVIREKQVFETVTYDLLIRRADLYAEARGGLTLKGDPWFDRFLSV